MHDDDIQGCPMVVAIPVGPDPLMPDKREIDAGFLHEPIPLRFKLQKVAIIRHHLDA
jgi:hypothetical protein